MSRAKSVTVDRSERSQTIYLTFEGLRESRTIVDKLTRIRVAIPVAQATVMRESMQPEDYGKAVEAAEQQVRGIVGPEPTPEPAPVQAPTHRTLYRVVRRSAAARDDFTSNLAKCLPMRGAELNEPLLWAGMSMFDTPDAAMRNARRFRGRLGTYLAELVLPLEHDPRVLVRQTLRPGHFTVVGCEDTCISLISNVQPIVGLSA